MCNETSGENIRSQTQIELNLMIKIFQSLMLADKIKMMSLLINEISQKVRNDNIIQ